jgi:PAS domain-containing protein
LVETDALGVCIYMNPRGTEISGRYVGGPANWAWNEVVHPDDCAEMSRSWAAAAAAGRAWSSEFRLLRPKSQCRWFRQRKAWSSEFRLLRPDGQTCWVNCLASPRMDNLGKIVGFVATFADITRRKQNEAALEQAHKELVVSVPA